MSNRRIILITALLLLTFAGHAGDIWVSPRGNDRNDGTRQSPKATLTSALRQAREWRRTGDNRVQGGITVYMEGGVYSLYEPVFVRPEDSGTWESPTVIRSVPGEDAVLSGGVPIRNWKRQGKLWVADVPAFNGRPLDFRQLWVDGRKATRARDVENFGMQERMPAAISQNAKREQACGHGNIHILQMVPLLIQN